MCKIIDRVVLGGTDNNSSKQTPPNPTLVESAFTLTRKKEKKEERDRER